MAVENLVQELVCELRSKLGRDLKNEELELIEWIQQRQFEKLFQGVKSS
ncbi:hypothetical protein [Halalkalibacter nanhaiisediminis]|uniref:Fur-regulated basic protein A n=1 Tax=Halalkalibacter nanhaiisediminis TaxID=688079 RepID=A0A562QJH7_9BACI|nr:hypothetical protein [Halalkalibacter nanhaiisediminis]TWI56884.1 hypothetical protein IQ10_01574 [Halalkalibacter nanhaiisediminis]